LVKEPVSHLRAVLLALFVTFLWSTSWVLIKLGLEDIPALSFAGLRYFLGFLCLLPLALRPLDRANLGRLSRRDWGRLGLLGLLVIAVTQGGQFLALALLPAVTVSLMFSFTPVVVALLGIALLGELLTRRQWAGIVLFLAGVLVYFYPVAFPAQQALGVLIAAVAALTNAVSAILARSINRSAHIAPLLVTTVSMGVGSVVLLGVGVWIQGLPELSPANWLIVGWLAVVNTALAFPLWNATLRTLSAVESSIINNTMLVQVAILAWVFLGEELGWQEVAGMALAAAGALIVQLRGRVRPPKNRHAPQSAREAIEYEG
jgi:drug/metabolite transporter (DMT)-like permease